VTTALFPGRFDPVTNGHGDSGVRAARLFDQVVVGVFDLPKGTLFSTEERVALFARAMEAHKNVTVKSFTGLTVDFAKKESAQVLVRGIRAVTGFEAEFDMALMNKRMAPELESMYLMSSLEHLFISGTRIREVARLGYDVTNLVPAHVAGALKQKLQDV